MKRDFVITFLALCISLCHAQARTKTLSPGSASGVPGLFSPDLHFFSLLPFQLSAAGKISITGLAVLTIAEIKKGILGTTNIFYNQYKI